MTYTFKKTKKIPIMGGGKTRGSDRPLMAWRSTWLGHGVIYAGPFRKCPKQMFGVNMAREIEGGDARVNVVDFDVPEVDLLTRVMTATYVAHLSGKDIYVGCMGGVGRTGTFLACWLKVMGEPNPVGAVRSRYNEHACETQAQEKFVARFPVWGLRWAWLKLALRHSRWLHPTV